MERRRKKVKLHVLSVARRDIMLMSMLEMETRVRKMS
jgi:hypothetical protein